MPFGIVNAHTRRQRPEPYPADMGRPWLNRILQLIVEATEGSRPGISTALQSQIELIPKTPVTAHSTGKPVEPIRATRPDLSPSIQ
jgi:hypothetical protein